MEMCLVGNNSKLILVKQSREGKGFRSINTITERNWCHTLKYKENRVGQSESLFGILRDWYQSKIGSFPCLLYTTDSIWSSTINFLVSNFTILYVCKPSQEYNSER